MVSMNVGSSNAKSRIWSLATSALLLAMMAAGPTYAQGGSGVHENGIGRDHDGDTNPATETRSGAAFNPSRTQYDSSYSVISFDDGAARSGKQVASSYQRDVGVAFSSGLTFEQCAPPQNTDHAGMCPYYAAPSGRFVGGFDAYHHGELRANFAREACVVAMSVYPTGGEAGEIFEVRLRGENPAGVPITEQTKVFTWRASTIKWQNEVGVYFTGDTAKNVFISVKSLRHPKRPVRFLIDDFAFVEVGCAKAIAKVRAAQDEQTAPN